MWHTHPEMRPDQSTVDLVGMLTMVSRLGQNHRRALMMIYGRAAGQPTAGLYIYESSGGSNAVDLVSTSIAHLPLGLAVV